MEVPSNQPTDGQENQPMKQSTVPCLTPYPIYRTKSERITSLPASVTYPFTSTNKLAKSLTLTLTQLLSQSITLSLLCTDSKGLFYVVGKWCYQPLMYCDRKYTVMYNAMCNVRTCSWPVHADEFHSLHRFNSGSWWYDDVLKAFLTRAAVNIAVHKIDI